MKFTVLLSKHRNCFLSFRKTYIIIRYEAMALSHLLLILKVISS